MHYDIVTAHCIISLTMKPFPEFYAKECLIYQNHKYIALY